MSDPSLPPAPPSNETLAHAPEFVIDDQWDDKEWRDIAARPSSTWTEAEKYLWKNGPRPHPWGHAGFTAKRPDGKTVTFPSKEAHDKHMRVAADKHKAGEDQAQNTLNQINAGLAAHARDNEDDPVAPHDNPEQADEMLQAAAPNGTVAG